MPGNSPVVSVVIPSYNHARFLEQAIESVLAQDYPHLELIVIDDGSTDGSVEVLRKYTGRFHWERQENQGQAAAVNRGWRMARGELLGYLSADDFLLPHAVRASADRLARNLETVVCYCDFNLVDPEGRHIRRVQAPDFDYRRMVTQGVCPPGPGAFFRRAAFEKAGPWDGAFRQYGDYDFWLRLGLLGRFERIPEVLASYRVHEGSQSFSQAAGRPTDEAVRIVEKLFADPRVPPALRAARSQALSSAYLQAARLEVRRGEYRLGLRAAGRAFTLYPRNAFAWRTFRLAANALLNRFAHRLLWALRGVRPRRG